MDKSIYVAMTGAKQALRAQAVNSHNLANVSTTGFRADKIAFQDAPVNGAGFDSRANTVATSQGWNDNGGAIIATGRELDVAINGDGFIAVQAPDGGEAYTRAGDFRLSVTGQLTTGAGHAVLGEGGPIAIPPNIKLTIGGDGTISIIPLGQGPETQAAVNRIKLVNPPPELLQKGGDGLLRTTDGSLPPPDAAVSLLSGSLETSNVNATEALVNMIELARQYEMQVKIIHETDENATRAAQLLRLNSS
ncbi:MAG: flagellar basal-body rod protein FlgF [Gammaproteobacteria bacterium]|nr:flagellar basal-body rod protein FlgF [Gammaproteobacteria bacterium]